MSGSQTTTGKNFYEGSYRKQDNFPDLGKYRINKVGADREYIGKACFEGFSNRGMGFRIRLRKSAMVREANKAVKLYKLFEIPHLWVLSKASKVHGCRLYLAGD